MHFSVTQSLQHLTFVKIVTVLWNESDIIDLISKLWFSPSLSPKSIEWQEVQDKVIEKIHKLQLPRLLKGKLLGIINLIGEQIFLWLEFHYRCNYIKTHTMKYHNFVWTSQGLINKKKMSEILVNDESLDICRRFKIACIYCLDEYIHILWEQLLQILDKKDIKSMECSSQPLISFWFYYLKGKRYELGNLASYYVDVGEDDFEYRGTPFESGFLLSAVTGNEVATKYFFEKLTFDEKKELIVPAAVEVAENCCNEFVSDEEIYFDSGYFPSRDFTPVLYFLLSEMNGEQMMKLFENQSCNVFKHMLEWPWQDYFIETTKHAVTYLSGEDYHEILGEILNKASDTHAAYNYSELFTVFWQQGLEAHKRYVLDHDATGLISRLLQIPDEKNFRLILKGTTDAEKEEFISSEDGLDDCQCLIDSEKWDLLELFIQKCLPSKSAMLKFKCKIEEYYEKYIKVYEFECYKMDVDEIYQKKNEKWDKFVQLLENCIHMAGTQEGEEKELCRKDMQFKI